MLAPRAFKRDAALLDAVDENGFGMTEVEYCVVQVFDSDTHTPHQRYREQRRHDQFLHADGVEPGIRMEAVLAYGNHRKGSQYAYADTLQVDE